MSSYRHSDVVVLWDIDGTLITHAPALQDRHERAVSGALGVQAAKVSNGLGKTDRQILIEIIQDVGFEPAPETLFSALAHLDTITRDDLAASPANAITGVYEILAHLHDLGVRQLLLTGNTRARAEAKITSAGLERYFDFPAGFYGDIATNRFELATQGRLILERDHSEPERLHPVIVGDTPLDIQAAQHAGMRVVAVATGSHAFDELRSEGPDLTLRDFTSDGHLLPAYVTTLMSKLGQQGR